tara:strand:- start:3273 stop:4553 length:1281 start_codon:yes stop_codon:yes gene_type:complete
MMTGLRIKSLCILWLVFVFDTYAQEVYVNSSVDETINQIERLRKDDIWWTVNGKDMLWNFKNLNKIFPTVTVYRKGRVRELQGKLNDNIDALQVKTSLGTMGFKEFLDSKQSTAMGVLILHKGKVVFEHYPRMKPHEKPVHWSVTKVIVSSLVAILEAEKKIDISLPIDFYLPELKDSDFKNITIKNILDMATGINCSENYTNKESCYYRYSMTVGDGYWDESSPSNPYEFIANMSFGSLYEQGTVFDYSGVNTFVLGWLVEKITDMQLQDALSEMIWTKIGTESDAAIFAPRNGVPVMHGGLLAAQRDVARFGLLFTPSYLMVSDQRIIAEEHIEYLLNEGRPSLIRQKGTNKIPKELRYNIYQWDMVYENGDLYKGGWAGQGLIVNPIKDYVVVWNSYYKDNQHSETGLGTVIQQVLPNIRGLK